MVEYTRPATWDDLKTLARGVSVRVLGLEGLLLTKEGMRDRDRADYQVLKNAIERLKGARP